ncbi:MAG: type II secretion system protein GspL [Desulfuromonadaceae bacterium]|nr:type II secretion system protein GspL [Desulfuromonadaceae bacterium]
MTQRNVGFEILPHCMRIAIFDAKKTPGQVTAVMQRDITPESDIEKILLEMLEQPPRFTDHFTTALTWRKCFVRTLHFPFKEKSKIDAAARIELESRVPTDISTYIIASLQAMKEEQGFSTISVAVPEADIAAALAPLDHLRLPVQMLGLSPFAEADGVTHFHQNVLLVKAHATNLLMCSINAGNIRGYKNCGPLTTPVLDLAQRIHLEAELLWRSGKLEVQPLLLIGEHVTDVLSTALEQMGHELLQLPWSLNGSPVAPEFLPVCALAHAREDKSINLRRGRFALKGGWSSIKKHLYTGGVLLTLSLILAVTTAVVTYRHKQQQAETYRKQMNQIFHQTLPHVGVVVDIPRQLKAELDQLEKRARLLGIGNSASALTALREVSRLTPEDIQVDIKRFKYEADKLELTGVTTDFDSVNRLGAQLRQTPLFTEVRISDAKMGLEGNKVDFRLQLTLSATGGQQ